MAEFDKEAICGECYGLIKAYIDETGLVGFSCTYCGLEYDWCDCCGKYEPVIDESVYEGAYPGNQPRIM